MRSRIVLAALLSIILFFSSFQSTVLFAQDQNNFEAEMSRLEEDAEGLADRRANNQAELEKAQSELAVYHSQSNSVKAQLDRLLDESAATQDEYDRLTQELNLAMSEVETSVARFRDAELALQEMQEKYEERISTLFKYRNKSVLEVLLMSDNINGFFTNLRLMSYIASADQRMLNELTLAQDDATIAKLQADEIARQAEIYFLYVDEQLRRLGEDIDLIATDMESLEQAILNRSAIVEEMQWEDELMDSELAAYYADMANLLSASELAQIERAESERIANEQLAAIQEPLPADATSEPQLPLPTPPADTTDLNQDNETTNGLPNGNNTTTANGGRTNGNTQSASPTPVVTTNTPTPVPSAAPPASTATPVPTQAPQTNTTTRATAAPTNTPTPNPTATSTPRATASPTPVPTSTPTPIPPTTTATTTQATTTQSPPTTNPPVSNSMMYPLAAYQSVSSAYGPRVHPITGNPNSFHYGTDFSAPAGTPIRAAMDGTVIIADKRWQGQTYTSHLTGYGNYVTIQHANGLSTTYAHLKYVTVEVGQTVRQGDFIGQVGSTGASTGPHLHFEVAVYGSTRNPMSSDYLGSSSVIR